MAADSYTRYVKGWPENLLLRSLDRNRTDTDKASILEKLFARLFERNKESIRPFILHSLYLVIEKTP